MNNKILIKQQGLFIDVIKNDTEIIGQFSLDDDANSIAISIFDLLKELKRISLKDSDIELILD